MDIRIAGTALAVIALILAGCGSEDSSKAQTSAAAPTSSAAPKPASDEDQVRGVLTQEGAAFTTWDFDKVGQLTCTQFREQAKSPDKAIPPMTMFPASDAAAVGPKAFADQLGKQFAGASNDSLLKVADAVIGQDEAAYKAAMLDVVKQSMTSVLVQVDNVVIKGDDATADITVTQRVGTQPPDTRTMPATLVREDGQWRDCTPPGQS
jgi:hypothetical protein